MKFKKISFIILYNILVVLFLLLISEGLIRLFDDKIQPQGTSEDLIKDNEYYSSFGLSPGAVGISNGKIVNVDKNGFRKSSIEVDTSKDSWLFLGDSVTMGIGVENDSTFAAIINKKLPEINILNPSTIGWSVYDYENVVKYFLANKASKFRIKKVFIFYCLNDLYDSEINKKMPGGEFRKFFGDFLRTIRLNSRLFIFIKNIFSDRPKAYFEYDKQFYNTTNTVFVKAIKSITEINSLCEKSGVDFIFTALPYEYQLRRKTNSQNPQQLIVNKLTSERIKAYNLSNKYFNKNIDSKLLYLYSDGIHFSNYGHKLIAEFLLKFVIK